MPGVPARFHAVTLSTRACVTGCRGTRCVILVANIRSWRVVESEMSAVSGKSESRIDGFGDFVWVGFPLVLLGALYVAGSCSTSNNIDVGVRSESRHPNTKGIVATLA